MKFLEQCLACGKLPVSVIALQITIIINIIIIHKTEQRALAEIWEWCLPDLNSATNLLCNQSESLVNKYLIIVIAHQRVVRVFALQRS